MEGNEGRTLGLGRETEGRGAGREVDGRLIDGVRLKPPLGRDFEGARLPPLPPRCACAVAGTSRQQTRTVAQEQRTNNCNFIFSLIYFLSVLDLTAHYQLAHFLTRRGFVNGDVFIVMSPRTVLTSAENAELSGGHGNSIPPARPGFRVCIPKGMAGI